MQQAIYECNVDFFRTWQSSDHYVDFIANYALPNGSRKIRCPPLHYAVYRAIEIQKDTEKPNTESPDFTMIKALEIVELIAQRSKAIRKALKFTVHSAHFHVHGRFSCEDAVPLCVQRLGMSKRSFEDLRWCVFYLIERDLHICMALNEKIIDSLSEQEKFTLAHDNIDRPELLLPLLLEKTHVLRNHNGDTLLHAMVKRGEIPRKLQDILRWNNPLYLDSQGKTALQLLRERRTFFEDSGSAVIPEEIDKAIREFEHSEQLHSNRDLSVVMGAMLRESKSLFSLLDTEVITMIVDLSRIDYECT